MILQSACLLRIKRKYSQKNYTPKCLNKDEANNNLTKLKQFCNLLDEDNIKLNTRIIFENVSFSFLILPIT